MEKWGEYIGLVKDGVDALLKGRYGSFCEILDGPRLVIYFRGPDGTTKVASLDDRKAIHMMSPDQMANALYRRGMEYITGWEREWRIRNYNERRKDSGIR